MRRGFTLVELMIALLIFGFIAAAAIAVLRNTFTSREIAHERLERLSDLQRMRLALANDLSQAAPRRPRGLDGEPALYAFLAAEPQGQGPFLTLVRRGWENYDAAPRASLQYVEYRLDQGRLERRVRAPVDGATLGPPQVLATGVKDVDVEAFVQGAWRPGYAARDSDPLPEAVRLIFEIEEYGKTPQVFLVTGGG